eukprot:CAMPEP_0195282378 /NCGR_PEP_ID=MMETSP0707-20130614/1275_1 /TAXON_ID=33640 /ORGANISM="Asterionellopsis glacialis, Strain CCMP134" /LENGTH=373 /DNA_ID=CAMNT_0040341343 /DNA_START=145 /DNA_END=1266 /DNA_ORIENTATION=+
MSAAPLQIPAELKKITPFIKRAEELDKDKKNAESRLVAYYCRQYAVHVGIPLSQNPASKQCLGQILGDLEVEKEAMSNFTKQEAQFLCTKFAHKIFEKADSQDRAGQATKVTARTFYAAATFFDILQQFGSPEEEQTEEEQTEAEDVKNKTIYAKWKATEILKALREGRQPTPGGYGNSTTNDDDDEEDEVKEEKEEEPSAPPSPPPPPKEEEEDPLASLLPPPPLPMPPMTVQESDDDSTSEEQQDKDAGTEVELLGPPPEYNNASKPPEVFVDDRPPMVPSIPPPPLPPPFMAPPPPQEKEPKKSSGGGGGGLFGLGHTKKKVTPPKKATKQQMEDATELTKFALSALQSKDSELAASRLEQALEALGARM